MGIQSSITSSEWRNISKSFFSVTGNKIEITWESDKEFKNRKGVYYISKKLFEEEVLKFIEIMFERRKIGEEKLAPIKINGQKIYAKRNYDTKMEF